MGIKTHPIKIKIPPKPTPTAMPIFSGGVRSRKLMSFIVPSNAQEAFILVIGLANVDGRPVVVEEEEEEVTETSTVLLVAVDEG